MLETTIEECLEKDPKTSKIFLGVFARNELPKQVKYPSCLIFNTKPRSHEGEHWCAIFYDKDGIGTFFDYYGQEPKVYRLESYLERTSKPYSPNIRVQGQSSYCGYYCMLFLLAASRGQMVKFYKFFNQDYSKNNTFFLIKKNFLSFFFTFTKKYLIFF